MKQRSIIATLVVALFIFSSFTALFPGQTGQGEEVLPDIYLTQATRPTGGNGQHSFSNESVEFPAGSTNVTGNLYTPNTSGKYPGIVFGVGYSETLFALFDSSNYGWIGEALASHGYVVLVLKYNANGDNPLETIQQLGSLYEWINQTVDAISYLQNQGKVDDDRIALMGHAVGGAVSICTAAEDKRVKNVVTFSPTQIPGIFQPSMFNCMAQLSPIPVQIQNGGVLDFTAAEGQNLYGSSGIPKQRVVIEIGTYEGFTSLGAIESGQTIPLPLPPPDDSITLGTRQHNHSISFAISFLNYYFQEDGVDYMEFLEVDYQETTILFTDPTGTIGNIDYTWTSSQVNTELNTVMVSTELDPDSVDLAVDPMTTAKAFLVPRGIGWGSSKVEVVLQYPEGSSQSEEMDFNDERNSSAGYFGRSFEIEKDHDIGSGITVKITATSTSGVVYESDVLSLNIFSSSASPTATLSLDKNAVEPDKNAKFTIGGSDSDGEVTWFKLDYGDGEQSGWQAMPSNPTTLDRSYDISGNFNIKLWVKDDTGAESTPVTESIAVSMKPTAKISVDEEVEVGKTAALDASGSTDPDDDDLEYFFDFGDGQDSGWVDTPQVEHTYTTIEEITVSLIVRDVYGVESETVTRDVSVVKEVEDDSPLDMLTGGGTGSILIIILVLVVVAALGAYFVFGGKDEHRSGGEDEYYGEDDSPEVSASERSPKPQAAKGGQRPAAPAPAAVAPPKTEEKPPQKAFAAPVLTEEMQKRIEERKKAMAAKKDGAPAPTSTPAPAPTQKAKPAAAPSPKTPKPKIPASVPAPVATPSPKPKIAPGPKKEEEKPEPEPEPEPEILPVIDDPSLPKDMQHLKCSACQKEFNIKLPANQKETGKTYCPRCEHVFSFYRKDWGKETGEKKDTLSRPAKPQTPRYGGVDVLDYRKK